MPEIPPARRSRTRIPLTIAGVIVGLIVAAFAVVQWVLPVVAGPVATVTFNQSAAIPDYDGSTYTIDDPARIDDFESLLAKHRVSPWMPALPGPSGCTGGTSTTLHIDYAGGMAADMRFYDCSNDGDFVDEVTSLLTGWKR